MDKEKTMNEHAEHRQRMKNRFLKNGLDCFDEHQVIELLLFFGIPRQDTNVIAHRLINRFGSLREVLEASYEELLEVEGIGEHAATLIKFSAELSRRYLLSEAKQNERFETVDKLGDYLKRLFLGKKVEEVYILTFTGKMEMLSCRKLADGMTNLVAFSVKPLIEEAILSHAACIVLAHNHPSGIASPSGSDIEITHQLEFICNQMSVPLIEHYVVAGNQYYAIIHEKRSHSDRFDNVPKLKRR